MEGSSEDVVSFLEQEGSPRLYVHMSGKRGYQGGESGLSPVLTFQRA